METCRFRLYLLINNNRPFLELMESSKIINGYPFCRYSRPETDAAELLQRSTTFYHDMDTRRSCRDFSNKPVPEAVIRNIVQTASTAPSGAHKQPWTFCVVADPEIKRRIRTAAEQEEYESYHGRLPEDWLEDLKPLQTDWNKEFLETAPYLIIVFKKSYEPDAEGRKRNTYYASESCGIACGFLLAAIHQAGLVSLTHTPSPMNFLSQILGRPAHEKPYLLVPVGYPADECWVPDISRRPLQEVAAFY